MNLRFGRYAAVVLGVCVCACSAVGAEYKTKKGTEILWDKWGVPHVFAKSVADMFFCHGWAQAEAHGDLLLHMLGGSRGRASEYFGAGENDKNLKNDRWVLVNEVPQRSAVWLAQQAPEFRGYLDAFAAGINGYAAKHPEAIDVESARVLPVTALDIINQEQHFVNFKFLAGEKLAAPVASASASVVCDQGLGAVETHISKARCGAPGLLDSTEDIEDLAGSNGWAIAPSHTTSGKAMMLMNPHLAMAGEQTYFEIQLTAPGVNLYGGAQLGMPSLRFAFSDQLAITNTVNTNNGALLYRITEADGGYMFDGRVMPYEKSTYPFKVKQKDGSFTVENVEVLKTVHGPIIRRDEGVPIAIHVAGLDKPFLLEQVWKMSTAKNFDAYQTQLKRLQIPMYNILYADREGHIEYLFNANVPRRPEGDFAMWQKPVAGDTSRLLPKDSLTYEELPKLIDPASGYVQNSNEPPWDAGWPTMIERKDYPAYISSFFPLFRSDRALRMLSEDKKMSFEMLLDKKLSTRVELADRILPDLLTAVDEFGSPRAKEAAAVLKAWDRQNEAASPGALLFYNWAMRFMTPSMSLIPVAARQNFAIPYDVNEPLTTPRGLKSPKDAAAMLDQAAEDTVKQYGSLNAPWGKAMRLQINRQSDGDVAVPRGTALNDVDLPGNGGFGNMGVFRVITWGPLKDGIRTPIHGDGFTIALEFGKVMRARALVTYGECSQPGCAHHTDQLPLFEKKQWREVWRTRAEIEPNLERREGF